MTPDGVIVTEHLTKSYGPTRGIVDVSLTVEAGEVFGFLGPNGAGKTTTIRTLLDFIRPTSGRATVFGMESSTSSVEIHRRVGYLPGEFVPYEHLTGREYLDFFASAPRGRRPASSWTRWPIGCRAICPRRSPRCRTGTSRSSA